MMEHMVAELDDDSYSGNELRNADSAASPKLTTGINHANFTPNQSLLRIANVELCQTWRYQGAIVYS